MRKWYVATVWFDDRCVAVAIVRANDTDKATEEVPYEWREFIEPKAPGKLKLWEVEILPNTQEVILNGVAVGQGD